MRPFSFQPPPISSLTSWAEHHITSYPEQSIISWATYHILSRASYHNYICHIKYINTVVVAVPTCNRVILVRYSPNLQHVLSKPANQNAESNHFLPCQIRGLQSANTKLLLSLVPLIAFVSLTTFYKIISKWHNLFGKTFSVTCRYNGRDQNPQPRTRFSQKVSGNFLTEKGGGAVSPIRGCSHITSAKNRGSSPPPPPSVSNGQHLADPPSPLVSLRQHFPAGPIVQ